MELEPSRYWSEGGTGTSTRGEMKQKPGFTLTTMPVGRWGRGQASATASTSSCDCPWACVSRRTS